MLPNPGADVEGSAMILTLLNRDGQVCGQVLVESVNHGSQYHKHLLAQAERDDDDKAP
jgi:hypothetical protein